MTEKSGFSFWELTKEQWRSQELGMEKGLREYETETNELVIKFAAMFKDNKPSGNPGNEDFIYEWTLLVTQMARLFEAESPLFSRKEFFKMCGMED